MDDKANAISVHKEEIRPSAKLIKLSCGVGAGNPRAGVRVRNNGLVYVGLKKK